MLNVIGTMGRMLKRLVAGAAGALCLAGCGAPIAIPSPSGGPPRGDSPAADLRAHITLLYGERTYVLAKLVVAGSAGRKDEYSSYARLLATNAGDLGDALSKAAGQGTGDSVQQARLLGDGFLVDYMVGVTTQQQAMADTALQNLNTKYVPQMAQVLSSALNISNSTATKLLTDEVTSSKQFIDDGAAGTPTPFYSDLRSAYATSMSMGSAVAEAVAGKFPDKYPGDPTSAGAKLRAQLDSLLQEHSYLATMATAAAAANDEEGKTAASGALGANTDALAQLFASAYDPATGDNARKSWTDENDALLAYALAPNGSPSATELTDFFAGLHASGDIPAQIQATVMVIDDQHAKSYDKIAAEDRYASTLLVAVGDGLLSSG